VSWLDIGLTLGMGGYQQRKPRSAHEGKQPYIAGASFFRRYVAGSALGATA